ncbi:MAG: hydroxyacid dehydrogenase [Candidatus Aenigmatarchaeota archaeon]
MKIVFYQTQKWEENYIKKKLKGHKIIFCKEILNEETAKLARDADAISIFIYSNVNKAVLDKMKKLKLVTTRSTGYDHIDLIECKRRGITVCNVPTYGENTVAEHTFALILSLSRKIHKSYLKTLRNDFTIDGLEGFDLKGKTIGVIGAGHIGLHVIRIAKGFGMNVLVNTLHLDKFLAEVMGFEYVNLEELLKRSDIITIHVPYNKDTHHLINKDNIKLIKKGAILINTARGGCVDTEALIEALDKGILSGAGLDVIEGEELIKEEKQLIYDKDKLKNLGNLVKDHILLSRDNVIFTPHIAFYSREALLRILDTTIENIEYFSKKTPINVVN